MTNQYNLGSYVTQDIDLYAKFGVTVSFDFRNSEPNREIVIPAGTTLHDNGIYNYFELYGNNPIAEPGKGRSVVGLDYFEEKATYEGHYLLNPEGWVASLDVTSGGDGWRYKFDDPMLMNTTLYIMWGVETYDVTVNIDSGTSTFDGKFTLAGATGSYSDGEITFSIEYGSTVGLSLGGFCISYMENSNTGVSISYTSGDMSATMVFRDAGKNGAEISITMKVTEAIGVTVEFDVVAGFTSDLDGDTLRVTIGGKEVTFTSEGSTQIVNIPIGSDVASSVDSSAFDYDVIVWLNGQRFTESSTVQDKDTITIHVSRIVDMMSFDGTGIDHLELQKVVVPNNLNDGWSYAEVEEIHDDDFQNGEYKVHENWRFTIDPEAEESVPADYLPSNTDLITQNGTIYVVNGNGNVTFIELSSTVTLDLIINLDGADDDNIGNIFGWTIAFTIDGGSTTFEVMNSTVTGKVTYEGRNANHAYSCSLPGFLGVSGTLDETVQELVLTLYPIEYTVEFLPFDGDNRGSVQVQWTVLDDLHRSEFPDDLYMIDGESEYVSSDGMPIVVEIVNGDQPKRFVEWSEEVLAISYSDFDASGIMNLTAVHKLHTEDLSTDGSVTNTIIVQQSELSANVPLDVGVLFDRDVTLKLVVGEGEVVTLSYSAGDQTLTSSGDLGTGMFTATAEGYRLYVYVLADGEEIE